MVAKKRILTPAEKIAGDEYWMNHKTCLSRQPRTDKPIIVAMIGPVGSGKSEVAEELAGQIGATVIANDEIRVELRKQKASYNRTWAIAEKLAIEIVQHGGNVVLDSDFVDAKKRASLRERAKKAGVRLVFICTYCDFDVMSQRIRENDPGEFFNSAGSKSTAADKGRDVKMRELLRRLPHHYRWVNKDGGQWVIKKPPCVVLADIDTTDPNEWKRKVEKCAKQLLTR